MKPLLHSNPYFEVLLSTKHLIPKRFKNRHTYNDVSALLMVIVIEQAECCSQRGTSCTSGGLISSRTVFVFPNYF